MSTVATALAPGSKLRWTVADAGAITMRNLRHIRRTPELLFFSTVQPVMFVLLFRYVFGGSIRVPGYPHYVDFLMPGIFVQTITFASAQTGVGLSNDMAKGIIDRFRSLPMARSAVLAGRTLADAVRGFMVALLMTGIGVLVGLRFHVNLVASIAALLLVVAFGFTFSWISATIGLAVHDPETAQVASFVWLFPLTFASSAFVDTRSLPGWLRSFARITPVTHTVDAVRALVNGGPTARPVFYSLAWIIGLLLVFIPLAVRQYRRAV